MVTWAEAHRLAIASSTRVLRRQSCSVEAPVPLSEIAEAEGIIVRHAPLPTIAGAYVAGDGATPPGILINTRLPWSKQRYTLGHELGHHCFRHGSQADLDTDWLAAGAGGPSSTDYEKLAEAFAAWVVMPRAHVESALRRLGLGSRLGPVGIYRLSLLLGASYRATCVHLSTLGRLQWSAVEALLKVQPKTIKRELLNGRPVSIGAADVHVVAPALIARHDVRSGDVLVLGPSRVEGDLPDLIRPVNDSTDAEQSYLVVQPHDIVNPVRPCTQQRIETSEGPIEVVVHHELSGISELWFR